MNKYFISYIFITKDGKSGVANMETKINTGITCINDIRAIEKVILNENKGYKKVIIDNYIEFPDLRKY